VSELYHKSPRRHSAKGLLDMPLLQTYNLFKYHKQGGNWDLFYFWNWLSVELHPVAQLRANKKRKFIKGTDP